jgi:hypothetical protein
MKKFGQFNKILWVLIALFFSVSTPLQAQDIVCTPTPIVATTNVATAFNLICKNNAPTTYKDFQIRAAHVSSGATVTNLRLSGVGCSANTSYSSYYYFLAGATCTLSGTFLAPANNQYTLDFDLRYGGRLFEGVFCGDNLASSSCISVISQAAKANNLVYIDVNPDTTIVPIGDKVQYKAVGTYEDGSTVDLSKVASWTSSTAAVASIGSNSGYVSTLTAGTTQITASYNGISSAAATLTATTASLTSLNISPQRTTIYAGTNLQFTVLGVYNDGSTADLTNSVNWYSSDPTIAAITLSNGLATAEGSAGTTNITASFHDVESNSVPLKVTIAPLKTIVLSPLQPISIPQLPAGVTQQYAALGTYSDGDTADITNAVNWTSKNSEVMRIDSSGLASVGNQPGSTTIVASLGGIKSNVSQVTVTPKVILTSIVVSSAAKNIAMGQTQQFSAIGNYSDGSSRSINRLVTWSSSNPKVAVITNDGLTLPFESGITNISAAYGQVSSTPVALTVGPKVITSIAVTPATATIAALNLLGKGGTKVFSATATYSDNSTGDVTSLVKWASANPAVATIAATGVATAAATVGSTAITAQLDTVTSPAATLTTAASTWKKAFSDNSNSVYVVGDNIYVATTSGTASRTVSRIKLSANAGQTWATKTLGNSSTFYFNIRVFANSNAIYVLANLPAQLYTSIDNGNTWRLNDISSRLSSPQGIYVSPDNQKVYIVDNGAGGTQVSSNAGNTWALASGKGGATPYGITGHFNPISQLITLYMTGTNGVYNSTDNAANWTTISATAAQVINLDIAASADGSVLGRITNTAVYYSTNAGATWTVIQNSTANAIYVSNDGQIICVATYNGLLLSVNKGASWQTITDDLASVTVNDVYIVNNKIYAATAGGLSIYG